MGPDSISALERGLRGEGFRSTGSGFATSFLRTGALWLTFLLPAFFLAEGLVLATFFLDAFLATGFFLLTFFLLAGFFFETFFLVTFFLDPDFFLDTFFVDFFAAGFLRATVFFFDAFFVDAFFLVTFDFLPVGFFLLTGVRLAAFFREVLAGLRFLLALFFAGIVYSCRFEKNAQLYIDECDMEALKKTFSRQSKFIHQSCQMAAICDRRKGYQARFGGCFRDIVFS